MPKLIQERIKKLRAEIAEIKEADRNYVAKVNQVGAAEHERRLERLQEILEEVKSLTDWKKP